MTKARHTIYVIQANLQENYSRGENLPVIKVDVLNEVESLRGHYAEWDGPTRIRYDANRQPGQARVWIETDADVEVRMVED